MTNLGHHIGQIICATGLLLLFGSSAAMADYVPSKKAPKPKQQPNTTTTGVRYQLPK